MCMYGYCRISQKKQSIERQIRNIKEAYPEAVIIEEAFTGTKIDRPEWNKLYKKAKSGDIIIFDSVSRMSRNAEDGFNTYEELYNRGINLVFLKEPHINTDTYKKSLTGLVSMTNTNVDFIILLYVSLLCADFVKSYISELVYIFLLDCACQQSLDSV